MSRRFPQPSSCLASISVNLLIAVICGLLVARSSSGRTEGEALGLREQALQEAQQALALGVGFGGSGSRRGCALAFPPPRCPVAVLAAAQIANLIPTGAGVRSLGQRAA